MPVHAEWISYGKAKGYVAYPGRAAGPLPALLVIQELWGVNAQIEDLCRRLAASGYVALAPDLYAAGGARPSALEASRIEELLAFMATLPPEKRSDPAARMEALSRLDPGPRDRLAETHELLWSYPNRLPSLLPPLREAAAHLRKEYPRSKAQPLGCVGFCMGGGLSALLVCEEPELEAAAVYYGACPPEEKVASIACPVLGFYASTDQRVNAGLPTFAAAMRNANKSFEYRIYEGASHGFFNETGAAYHVDAARDSWVRLLDFFASRLARGRVKEARLGG